MGQLFDTRALIDHQPSIAMTNISLTKDRLIIFIAPILRNSDLAVLNVVYSFYLPAFCLRRLYLHNKTLCQGNMTLRFKNAKQNYNVLFVICFKRCFKICVLKLSCLLYRRLRLVRRATYRKPARKISVRARRILPESISQPANAFRQTPAETAFVTDRQLTSHRTAVLREASGQDAHRDLDKGHVAVGEFVLVAVHGDHVTYDVETARGGLIDALRLPAISAEPALRLPEVPA